MGFNSGFKGLNLCLKEQNLFTRGDLSFRDVHVTTLLTVSATRNNSAMTYADLFSFLWENLHVVFTNP